MRTCFCFCVLVCSSLRAQQITFGGCVSAQGVPVASVAGTINDVAQAFPSQNRIVYNPNVLGWLQAPTRLFMYAHECAHLAVPTSDEADADCWAAKTLRDRGLLGDAALRAVKADINRFARADWTHVSGGERNVLIDECLARTRAGDDDDDSSPAEVWDSVVQIIKEGKIRLMQEELDSQRHYLEDERSQISDGEDAIEKDEEKIRQDKDDLKDYYQKSGGQESYNVESTKKNIAYYEKRLAHDKERLKGYRKDQAEYQANIRALRRAIAAK